MKLSGSCFEGSVQCELDGREECVECFSRENSRRKVLLRNEISNSKLLMNERRGEAERSQ